MSTPGYQPSLDGLRGVCLAAVLLFHAGSPAAAGGYLGVSTFFTLSGFLITGLLLADTRPGPFWARRARRLLPASLLTLIAIGATGSLWLPADRLDALGTDLLATLLYVVNWRFVEADYAYALLFSQPSPVQHFWSLAIEGQFYLALPPLLALARRLAGRRGIAVAVALGAAASTAVAVALGDDPGQRDRIYFGTDTRAAELLAGAGVALARPTLSRIPAGLRDALGAAALAGLLFAFAGLDLDTPALYRGGLLGVATLSAGVLVGCLAGGRLARALAWGPLVWIGRISYGAYLFHWPLYQAIAWDGASPLALFVVRVGATLLLADLSYRWLEEPVRRGRALAPPRFGLAAGAASLGLAAAVLAVQPPTLARDAPTSELDRFIDAMRDEVTVVAFLGDSTAFNLRHGYEPWAAGRPDVWLVPGSALLGCGLLNSHVAERQLARDGTVAQGNRPACAQFFPQLEDRVRQFRPDILVVAVGVWEMRGIALTPGHFSHLPEPAVVDAMEEALARLSRVAALSGAHVVWLTPPRIRPPGHWQVGLDRVEAGRLALRGIVRRHAAERPRFHIVDLATYAEGFGDGPFDARLRPDGVHYRVEAAEQLVREWLGEQTLVVRKGR